MRIDKIIKINKLQSSGKV